jgi:hypothetical protein
MLTSHLCCGIMRNRKGSRPFSSVTSLSEEHAVRAPEPPASQNDPSLNPTGPRTYEDTAVRPHPQGPNSPGASEPGDMGAPEKRDYEKAPKQTPPSEGGLGYRGA